MFSPSDAIETGIAIGRRGLVLGGPVSEPAGERTRRDQLIGAVRRQAGQQADGLVFDKLDSDLRVPLAEIMEKYGQWSGRGTVDGADPQRCRPCPAVSGRAT